MKESTREAQKAAAKANESLKSAESLGRQIGGPGSANNVVIKRAQADAADKKLREALAKDDTLSFYVDDDDDDD